jgi:prolyl 4-hydroxylase
VSTNYAWLPHNLDPSIEIPREYRGMMINPLGNRQSFYDEFMESCRKPLGLVNVFLCQATELDRIKTVLEQPQSMQNYTEIGYKKIKAPKELFTLLSSFWERNRDKAKPEVWGPGNTYTNNWESPSEMVSFEDTTLRGGGEPLKGKIWDISKDVSASPQFLCSVIFIIVT